MPLEKPLHIHIIQWISTKTNKVNHLDTVTNSINAVIRGQKTIKKRQKNIKLSFVDLTL